LIPFCRLRLQFKVEAPEQPCDEKPHLKICETKLLLASSKDERRKDEGQVNRAH
jgi:hypothetical protein